MQSNKRHHHLQEHRPVHKKFPLDVAFTAQLGGMKERRPRRVELAHGVPRFLCFGNRATRVGQGGLRPVS